MRPIFDTPATRLFGIEIPIVQGPMAWLSEPPLVAAVSNEGGLGVLAAATKSVDEFESDVARTQTLTDRPFAANFPIVLGDYAAHIEMVIARRVPIVFMSAGSPELHTARLKSAGIVGVHVVPNLALARTAIRYGVDAIVLESWEAGGHVAPDGITAMTNIRNVAKAIDRPIIAAGGIADGFGFAAALCLGAHAVQMGTRFIATRESNSPAIYREKIVGASEGDVRVFSRGHHPARALRSAIVDRAIDMEYHGASSRDVRAFIGVGRARKAAHDADENEGIFYAGASAVLVDDVPTVKRCSIALRYDRASGRAWRDRRTTR